MIEHQSRHMNPTLREDSKDVYPLEYTGAKPIGEQVRILRSYWPELNVAPAIRFEREVLPWVITPEWAEGAFALIRPTRLAAYPAFNLDRMFLALASSRWFIRHSAPIDEMDRHWRSAAALRPIEAEQVGDILVVPAQFGMRHWNRSMEEVRWALSPGEFELSAFDVACMLLTHPERLSGPNDLRVGCPAGWDLNESCSCVFHSSQRVDRISGFPTSILEFGLCRRYEKVPIIGSATAWWPPR